MIIHRANTRGYADHGWLKSYHTFSFAGYYNPERMHFGKLRVLNDDVIEGGSGFGMHPHNNMEIISIPLKGALHHRDSSGSDDIVAKNKVQVMSTGKGIMHSEHNAFPDRDTNFLQIWIYPKSMNIEPRYNSQDFNPGMWHNKFQLLVSPDGSNNSLTIHQKAWLSRISLDNNAQADYRLYSETNGVYLFLIDGEIKINGETLHPRDGAGITGEDVMSLAAAKESDILVFEVPLK